ncbi:sigma-70 family RNA polymerase sigma factor [Candidatus Peregrinibacteria bacterium]|jgi:RNA polymerase sigma-70 factor, ECF subfamily|nr:sigma-70 family RNA polymerase sigma factor [Candidatus Peregrinibacteria bacterium]MBT4055870.1 sigma-70 family RNA polymerase sigma factor [Candidatus Peregrinibacteria bacterium]
MKVGVNIKIGSRVAKGLSKAEVSSVSPDQVQKDEMVELLVKRAQKGDADAFGKLYDIFVDQIYRYIYFRVPANDVEDLTETVFLKSWEKIHQYKSGKKRFSAWLFRIAHNLVVDTYRFNKDKNLVELTPNIPEYRREHNPIKTTESALHSDYLKEALAKLKPHYKQIVILKFINELSNQEISEILKKSEGSIRILQFRALKALKIELEKKGADFT